MLLRLQELLLGHSGGSVVIVEDGGPWNAKLMHDLDSSCIRGQVILAQLAMYNVAGKYDQIGLLRHEHLLHDL